MKKKNITYREIISLFPEKNVLVIGDFILDVYLRGNSTRLCPEAPVPVVDIESRHACPGGAANTACNLKELGAGVTFCTVIGSDAEGEDSASILQEMGIDLGGVIREEGRDTIVKTRIMSGGHPVTRYDRGTISPVSASSEQQLIEFIRGCYASFDVIFFSDYDKGVITSRLLDCIASLQAESPRMLVVDSKRLPFFAMLKPDLVKPNYNEAVKLAGRAPQAANRIAQVKSLAEEIHAKTNAALMAISMDEEGSLIVSEGKFIHRCFAHPVSNPQVSGAGDTYLSAFTLCMLVTGDANASGEVATAAASIAIRKDTTSVCRPDELIAYFDLGSKLVSSEEQLERICADLRRDNKRIVFTNGCFDILHSGHVTYLHCAKKKGDILIVGLNNDESIRRLKGSERPINPLKDRLQVIAGLGAVDYVIPFGNAGDDTPTELIRLIRPQVFAKGGDYTRDRLPEAAVVEEFGGEVIFIPYVAEKSTTNIIRQIGTIRDMTVKKAAGMI